MSPTQRLLAYGVSLFLLFVYKPNYPKYSQTVRSRVTQFVYILERGGGGGDRLNLWLLWFTYSWVFDTNTTVLASSCFIKIRLFWLVRVSFKYDCFGSCFIQIRLFWFVFHTNTTVLASSCFIQIRLFWFVFHTNTTVLVRVSYKYNLRLHRKKGTCHRFDKGHVPFFPWSLQLF